ncbi:MAG: HTH-type transcriptional regulator GltC [Rhodospirillaceae bacterium]|jgi:DNA-binding transcriptional LysR family regulator|nr:LysR family transcriptional regulator [Alphaproteobacteria bacterium]CAI8285934.1 MAG: HTH-type transcriptional regulator GltC [Rhodospirillaceae bacterium]
MRHLTHLKYIDVVAREGSIRKAAEKLNITSTALNRRILSLEEEVGTSLFERLPSGVRLNTAGELFIQHIRYQMTDLSRVLSQIADLSGIRRGHVRLGAGQELVASFLPEQIGLYRKQFTSVSFEIATANPNDSLRALREFEIDIAMLFDAVMPSDVQIVATVEQRVHAFMHKSHPLADKNSLRLQDCLNTKIMLPQANGGLRTLLDVGQLQANLQLEEAVTADDFNMMFNYAAHEAIIGFHIPLGFLQSGGVPEGLVFIPLDERDVGTGLVHLVQAKGRVLPVAAAKFLDQLLQSINERFPEETR